MRVCLEKKQQVLAETGELAVPDVKAAVQELMTNLFISVTNHSVREEAYNLICIRSRGIFKSVG